MEYDVIFGDSIQELAERMDDVLSNGWQAQGGICVMQRVYHSDRTGCDEVETMYYQAIVRVTPVVPIKES